MDVAKELAARAIMMMTTKWPPKRNNETLCEGCVFGHGRLPSKVALSTGYALNPGQPSEQSPPYLIGLSQPFRFSESISLNRYFWPKPLRYKAAVRQDRGPIGAHSMQLVEAIEHLDEFRKSLERERENGKARIRAIKDVLGVLESGVQSRVTLSIEPSSVICQAFEYGCRYKKSAVLQWNDWMTQLRSLFQKNQRLRNTFIHRSSANAQRQKLERDREQLRSFFNDLEQILAERRTISLSQFVTENLEPIYTAQFHIFETRFFSSVQRPMNPCYVSDFLRRLRRSDSSSIVRVLKSELDFTSSIVVELRRNLIRAESESLLANYEKRYLSRQVVQKTARYSELNQEIESLRTRLKTDDERFRKTFENFRCSLFEWTQVIRRGLKLFSDSDTQFNLLNSRRRVIQMENDILNYLAQILRKFENSVTLRVDEPFREWEQQAIALSRALDGFIKDGQLTHFEGLVPRLGPFKNRLFQGVRRAREVSQIFSQLVQEQLRYEDVHENQSIIKQIEDKRARILIARKSFPVNFDRLREFENLTQSLFGFFDDLQNSPAIGANEICANLRVDVLTSELELRRRELTELQEIVKLREARKQELQNLISDSKEMKKSRELETDSIPEVGKEGRGIDAKYTQMRMLLSCAICDRLADVFVPICGHMICSNCCKKAKKVKTMQCPVCHIGSSDFVQINYFAS
jgi:hypothetical protein